MVIKRFFVSWVLFVFILCGACSTVVSNKHHEEAPPLPPFWLNDAALDGHLAVTASAMPQRMGGIEGQRRAALLRARAELAKNTRVFVKGSFVSRQTQDQVTFDQKLSIRASELQQLIGSNVRAEWVDLKTGELFIWYVIPLY